MVKNIALPIFENSCDRIVLGNHTLKQLNIINDNNYTGSLSSVSSLLNKCKTSIGKRRFNFNLLHPTNNVTILNREYEITDFLLNLFKQESAYQETSENYLKQIKDIEIFQRKLLHNKITPLAIVNLYDNVNTIKNLFEYLDDVTELKDYIKQNKLIIYDKILSDCETIMKYIDDTINLEIAQDINFVVFEKLEKSFFKRGINQDFDELEESVYDEYDKLIAYKNYFNSLFDNPTPEYI